MRGEPKRNYGIFHIHTTTKNDSFLQFFAVTVIFFSRPHSFRDNSRKIAQIVHFHCMSLCFKNRMVESGQREKMTETLKFHRKCVYLSIFRNAANSMCFITAFDAHILMNERKMRLNYFFQIRQMTFEQKTKTWSANRSSKIWWGKMTK